MAQLLKLSALVVLFGLAACSQPEPEPAPPPVIEPEPVFTGKV